MIAQLQESSKAGTQSQEVNEVVSINILSQAFLSQLSSPEVIPYSTNILANPSLQDGRFGTTSLFSTNEFFQGNIFNIACFLQCIATFLKQRKLKGYNDKDIPQLKPFGKAAWTFVLAIYKAEWDQINTADNITFQFKAKSQFERNQPSLQSSLVNTNRATRINHVPLFLFS